MQITIPRAIVVLASEGYRLRSGLRHYSLRLPHLRSHEEEEEVSDNILLVDRAMISLLCAQ